jgi:hypothetical protein
MNKSRIIAAVFWVLVLAPVIVVVCLTGRKFTDYLAWYHYLIYLASLGVYLVVMRHMKRKMIVQTMGEDEFKRRTDNERRLRTLWGP